MGHFSVRHQPTRPVRQRPRFRPQLEALEARCVPAQVLFGNVLKETFDDPSDLPAFVNGAIPGATRGSNLQQFDDFGRVAVVDPVTGKTTYQQTRPVFHHLVGSLNGAELENGGTTDPVAPGDSAAFLTFSGGSDFITFPDVDNSKEGVVFAAIDVTRGNKVIFFGTNGTLTLTVPFNSLTGYIAVGSPPPGASGSAIGRLGPPSSPSWVTVGVNAVDAQVNGVPSQSSTPRTAASSTTQVPPSTASRSSHR